MTESIDISTIEKKEEKRIIRSISAVSFLGNALLAALKFTGGILGGSGAMISDGVHSLADVLVTLTALLGVKLSQKEADASHPYGHERFECLASLLLGLILTFIGVGIGCTGAKNIFSGQYEALAVPSVLALAAAGASILIKEGMFRYTRFYAKKINSAAFTADAWHHRTDAMSSVGSLLGIGGAMLGFPVLDSVASLAICLFILKVAYGIIKDGLIRLVDTACRREYENRLRAYIEGQSELFRVERLRTRMFGNRVYADSVISVSGNPCISEIIPVIESLQIGVKNSFPDIKEIMIELSSGDESI